MGRPVLLLSGLVLLAALSLYWSVRLEDNLQDSDAIRKIYMITKTTRFLCGLAEILGIAHPVTTSRFLLDFFTPPIPVDDPDVKISEDVLDGIPVRFYIPKNKENNGAGFVWIHGGGWTSYSMAHDDFICVEFAKRLGIVVMSIEYRLAPEYPYPVPFDDSYSATVAFLNSAQKYDINPDRVFIGGGSSGANLAAAVSLKLRDTKVVHQPILQVLVVPCLQATDFMTPSYQENAHNEMLPAWWMINYWLWYAKGTTGHQLQPQCFTNNHTSASFKQSKKSLYTRHDLIDPQYLIHPTSSRQQISQNHGDDEIWADLEHVLDDPYFAPLLADDLQATPPAYVITAQYDVLRDDGILYARRLEKAGVRVEHKNYEGAVHSVYRTFDFELSQKCMGELVDYLKAQL